MTGASCTVLFAVIPLIAGIFVFIRSGARDPLERVLLTLLAPAMGIALYATCFWVVDFAVDDWSGAKLAPVMAMVRGQPQAYQLYQDPLNGVMTGWIYGPAPALMFLPATIFDRPTPALICGSVINVLCTMIPAIWILVQSGRRNWLAALLGICLFLILCITHKSLRLAVFQIGPDGPALGFVAGAIACLIHHQNRWMRLILSALLAALAIWSKQTLLPFLCIVPIYLALSGDRKAAIRWVVLTAAAFLVLSIIFIAAFGPLSWMWFHMVHLPASQGWVESGQAVVWTLLGIFGELLVDCSEAIAILLLLLMIPRQRHGANAWIMLLMAAAVGIPGAVLGYVKIGGDINNFALTGYFLTLGVASLFAQILAPLETTDRLGVLLRSGVCLVIVVTMGLLISNPSMLDKPRSRLADPSDNAQEIAYRYLKQHPDEAYFPWNPLGAVLAEGKLYHFEWGLIDRALIDPALVGEEHTGQLVAHIPIHSRLLAAPKEATTKFAQRYFPTFVKSDPDPELPGFVIYTFPPATQSGGQAQ